MMFALAVAVKFVLVTVENAYQLVLSEMMSYSSTISQNAIHALSESTAQERRLWVEWHIRAVGTAIVYSKITGNHTWPGFTNSDEICPHCKLAPGSEPCHRVEKKYNGKAGKFVVTHSNILDPAEGYCVV